VQGVWNSAFANWVGEKKLPRGGDVRNWGDENNRIRSICKEESNSKLFGTKRLNENQINKWEKNKVLRKGQDDKEV